MRTANIKLIRALLYTPYKGRWGIPFILWSKPGAGKTAVCDQAEDTLGMTGVPYYANSHDKIDIGGLPKANGTKFEYLAPPLVDHLLGLARSMLMLDEVTTLTLDEQGPMLRVTSHHEVAGMPLAKSVRLCAAANPPECATGGSPLSQAFANRLLHLEWAPSTEQYCDYLRAGGEVIADDTDWDALEKRVQAAFPAAFQAACSKVAGFISTRPELETAMPEDPLLAGNAWPSRRTWEMAAHALACVELHNLGQADARTAVEGCVGKGAAVEFFNWLENSNLPTASEVLNGAWKADPSRPDITDAALGTALAFVTRPEENKGAEQSNHADFWKAISAVAKVHKGIAAAYARRAKEKRLFEKCPEYTAACSAVISIIRA